jgi:prepilin-type N-terminal cleavage/methylation domain-containing protein
MKRRDQDRRGAGFTLVELLAVIAIMLVLASVFIPTIRQSVEKSQGVVCRSNMGQLQNGFYLRAQDVKGMFPFGGTEPTNPESWADHDDFRNGVIWPYVGEERVYACPSYPAPGRFYLKRHYSTSGFINSEGPSWGARYTARGFSQVKNTAKTHVLIEEYDHRAEAGGPYSGPHGSFVVGYGGVAQYVNNWIDTPMMWHSMGAFFSYVDGHVEYRRWVGPRMLTVNIYTWKHVSDGAGWPSQPDDALDFAWLVGGVTNGYIY